ncbi:MAG: amino acid-binding protein [Rhizobiaceae bacterium]|jgi:glycine betaine/proline transport system substrate-binding protein|nr:amino acid-binding protein [Rhizobiaceae bacterium]MBO6724790.1 amino acid-binding protein [Rhizobiaceae bacterium]
MPPTGFLRFSALFVAGVLFLAGPAIAAPVVIGVPTWPSANVTAQIIAQAAEQMDVEVELRPRGTMTLVADMAEGEADIHPELWFPNLEGAVERLNGDGRIVVSDHGVEAHQNVCVTKATAEMTGINALSDLADPQIAVNFDSDRDGKGEIWIGAPTWSSTEIEHIRARSYGYFQTMSLLELPEEIAMAAVDVAASFGSPIVFYCYAPHHVFDLHELVVLEEPDYDAERWNLIKRADDPYWLQKSRAETAWDVSHFHVAYAKRLEEDEPEFARFLGNIAFEPADITAISYAFQVERKPAEQVAAEWISRNEDRLKEWMQ